MEFPRLMRTVIAQYFRGSELARLTMSRRREGTSPHVRMFDFLYEEEPDTPLDPAAGGAPLAHLAQGVAKSTPGRTGPMTPRAALRVRAVVDTAPALSRPGISKSSVAISSRPTAAKYCGWGDDHAVNWLCPHHRPQLHPHSSAGRAVGDVAQRAQARHPPMMAAKERVRSPPGTWSPGGNMRPTMRGPHLGLSQRAAVMYVAGDATAAYSPSKARQVLRQISSSGLTCWSCSTRLSAPKATSPKPGSCTARMSRPSKLSPSRSTTASARCTSARSLPERCADRQRVRYT